MTGACIFCVIVAGRFPAKVAYKDDVTIRVRREGGRTRVSVRSKSRIGRADFGQNARNIQLFLRELDQELFGVGSGKPL